MMASVPTPLRASPMAVVGLGLMGSRMAARLIGDGFTVRGHDTDPERLAAFQSFGGVATGSAAAAVQGCGAVVLSLPTTAISRRVCLGPDGVGSSGVAGLVVYDTTTGHPDDAVELASALGRAGIDYSDSTVSGNGEVAERGELVVMVGGERSAYELGIPIFESIGRSHHYVGPAGAGARMKLIVNHTLTIHRMALAEALVVAELTGIDLDTALTVLKDGLSYSRAMDAWGERMVAGEHERPFSRLRQGHKDACIICEHGRAAGATMDLVEVVREALAEGEGSGLGEFDNSSVVEVVRRRAGIGRVR